MFTTSLKTFLLTVDHLEVLVEKTPLFALTVQPKDRVTKEDLQEITVITHQELEVVIRLEVLQLEICLLYTSPSPRDRTRSRMPSSA